MTVTPIILNGDLSDWTTADRLDLAGGGVVGFEMYGKVAEDGAFVFALSATDIAIGEGTTLWLDTDLDRTTGHQIFGFAGGAEFNVTIGADGIPRLFTGDAGETLVSGAIEHAFSADGRTVELRIPAALVGQPGVEPAALTVYADINDQTFIPNDYDQFAYRVEPVEPPSTSGAFTLDGALDDWSEAQRLDTPIDGVADYAVYGASDDDSFIIAIQSPVAISQGTTIWLNTDGDQSTGFQVFGFAAGAEFNINIDADGVAALYTGDAGQTLVPGAIQQSFNAARGVLELSIDKSALAAPGATTGPEVIQAHIDINDSVFIPNDYSSFSYTIGQSTPPTGEPQTVDGVTLDGALDEWAATDRLDTAADGVDGFSVFGQSTDSAIIIAIDAPTAIGQGTTIWLNTDDDQSTGFQVFGFAAGAEYNINIGADGAPALYTGDAGQTLVSDNLSFGFSADGKTMEIAIAKSDLAGAPDSVDIHIDVNESAYIPNDYAAFSYQIGEQPVTPPTSDGDAAKRVAIVYSETSAANYFSETAYGQLFMAAQNQAMMAGTPFDVLSETDLIDATLLAQYDAIVFPAFSHVNSALVDAITSALTTASVDHGVGFITAGDFMTNDETGGVIGTDPYARMHSLLGIDFKGFGQSDGATVTATVADHAALDGYSVGETIHTYEGEVFYTHYEGANPNASTTIATMTVGQDVVNAAIVTENGGLNTHFATDAVMGDGNLIQQAIDYAVERGEISVDLKLSRNEVIVASRTDMDQSQEHGEVAPDDGRVGIYETLIPILEQWKADYGFVGSYYINVGDNAPEQFTDWSVSKPFYDAILDLGNEIGTHSYTHPEDTNTLTATQIAFEFLQSKLLIEQELGIEISGAAVPGAPEFVETSIEISQYFDYLTGGFSGIGAGYPGAIGFLDPDHQDQVYLAPNVSFDFSLVEFLGLTPAQASAVWTEQFNELIDHASTPIVHWPWHDYGPTEHDDDPDENPGSFYTQEMFTDFIAAAFAAGSEFVTTEDLAARIKAFHATELSVSQSGDVITAKVAASDVGRMALDLDLNGGTGIIQSVAGWYAYDQDSIFLPNAGGEFAITLGQTQDDVTHITSLDQRMELQALTGDGEDLSFSIQGEGDVVIDLMDLNGRFVDVHGGIIKSLNGDQLTLTLDLDRDHNVTVDITDTAPTANIGPVADNDFIAISADATAISLNALMLAGDTDADDGLGQLYVQSVNGAGATGNIGFRMGEATYDTAGRFDALTKGEFATDTLSYTVSDGRGGVDTATVTVQVEGARAAANLINGNSSSNFLFGSFGRDKIDGQGGNDFIFASFGDDDLYGGLGNDRLMGDSGNDLLNGGQGNDDLNGGAGADIFQFSAAFGEDVIQDFTNGVDLIDLSALNVGGFDALIFEKRGSSVEIEVEGQGFVTLQGIKINALDADDFIF